MKKSLFTIFMLGTLMANAQWFTSYKNDFKGDFGIGLIVDNLDGAGMNFYADFISPEKENLIIGGEFGFIGYTGPLAEGYHTYCSDYSCRTTYSDGRGSGQGGWIVGARLGTFISQNLILMGTGGVYLWEEWRGYKVGQETLPYLRLSIKNVKGALTYEIGANATLDSYGPTFSLGYNF